MSTPLVPARSPFECDECGATFPVDTLSLADRDSEGDSFILCAHCALLFLEAAQDRDEARAEERKEERGW